jgi:peroxiredoxin
VADLVRQAEKFEARKVPVVLVYPGPADGLKAHAEEFEGGKGLPKGFHLAMDPDYAFTKAYDLRWDEKGETAYPSTFVIEPGGKIAYAEISRSHAGRAKASEVLQALGD